MNTFNDKYGVIINFKDGEQIITKYHYFKHAKRAFEAYLGLNSLESAYITTYTKTRGFGQIIRRY